jgi:hypothetical protein
MKKGAQSDFRQAQDEPDLVRAGKGKVLPFRVRLSPLPLVRPLFFNTFRWQNLILWNEI